MAMRDLVSGGAVCAVPGSSSSSNPLGALANVLIGSSSKSQERLKEIPTLTSTSDRQFVPEQFDLPGSEFDQPFLQPHAQASEFFNGFRSSGDASGLADAWDEIQHPQATQPALSEFHGVYGQGSGSQIQPTFDGPPQRVLSNFLHSFVGTSRGGIPFHPTALPVLGLSQGDKQCIRDRSSIMARHIFADKSEDFIESQVNALLASLDIDNDAMAKGFTPGRCRELEDCWNESQSMRKLIGQSADGWVAEYGQQRLQYGEPEAWAHSFEQQHGAGGWASEFEQEQFQLASMGRMNDGNIANLAAMEQTRLLANTLAQNEDPKFQNSQFLQFLSKMSQGELIIDDNRVKQTSLSTSDNWASAYQQQYHGGSTLADEFVSTRSNQLLWVDEFSKEVQRGPHDQWVNEFSKLNVDDWVEEFGQKVGEGALGKNSNDNWADSYDEFLNGQIPSKQDASKGIYVFSDMNPYVGHPDPLKEGQELFHRGLLSEAVLALEAEVLKNPENAEVWRLLGVTHAENDDDQQAIAAMMRAQEADPTNLEVLLALGVSHTNEVEHTAALKYLYGWLRHHPKLGILANPDLENTLYYNDIARVFNEAARMMPDDADVHVVIGVLYSLVREYEKAISSFQTALKLKPQDYSLWNKLGATKANSIQSADAISAYQKALDLKPNYVRAWANMGIGYANQGLYEESVRYYVRALCMNPKADNTWQYLRLALSCASRNDMFEACDSRNLDALQKEFPL